MYSFPFFNVSHCVSIFTWENGSNNAAKHMLARQREGKSFSHTLFKKRPSRSSKPRIGKTKVRFGDAPPPPLPSSQEMLLGSKPLLWFDRHLHRKASISVGGICGLCSRSNFLTSRKLPFLSKSVIADQLLIFLRGEISDGKNLEI